MCCYTVNIRAGRRTRQCTQTASVRRPSARFTQQQARAFHGDHRQQGAFQCDGARSQEVWGIEYSRMLERKREFDRMTSQLRSLLLRHMNSGKESESCSQNMSAAIHIRTGMLATFHNVVTAQGS